MLKQVSASYLKSKSVAMLFGSSVMLLLMVMKILKPIEEDEYIFKKSYLQYLRTIRMWVSDSNSL